MNSIKPSGANGAPSQQTPPTASDVSGPTAAITASRRAVVASSSMDVTPPRKCSSIDRTVIPYDFAASACDTSCSSTDRYSSTAKAAPAT
jgi:hypothetical protein